MNILPELSAEHSVNLESITQSFREFMKTIIYLRGPEGCEWDRQQTLYSLRRFLIEEAFEVITAINHAKPQEIKEEVGDVLLVILLLANVGEDQKQFKLNDIFLESTEKLIRRHPHVFKNIQDKLSPDKLSPEKVRKQWHSIKEVQEGKKGIHEPSSYPPLERAAKIQKKAVRKGFDWQNSAQLLQKVREELDELENEINTQKEQASKLSNKDYSTEKIEGEFGDLLFSVISIGRIIRIDPSLALHRTNEKFIKRFQYLEEHMNSQDMNSDNLDEMMRIWNQAKEFDS